MGGMRGEEGAYLFGMLLAFFVGCAKTWLKQVIASQQQCPRLGKLLEEEGYQLIRR